MYSLALSPSLSLSFPGSKSLSISPSLLPVPPYFSHTLSRTSTPFWLLPRPPPYPPNESAPTGALLASLSNPRVRLVNTRTYTHSCSTFRNRQARCDSRNERLLPPSSRATPSGGCIVCMCLTAAAPVAAPTRETPTVGIVYRGIQRPYCLALSPLLDKPLLIYLLNNTTAALSFLPHLCPGRSLLLTGYVPHHFQRRVAIVLSAVLKVADCVVWRHKERVTRARAEGVNWSGSIGTLRRERSDYRKWEIRRY